jgi:hypothetical protein
MIKILNRFFLFGLAITGFLLIISGCMSMDGGMGGNTMYTFGDANYDHQLREGVHPVKYGPIQAGHVPENFPHKFLAEDGSYAGGHVYPTIQEARQAVMDAKRRGIISQDGDWGIYELEGDWHKDAYPAKPGEYHLRKTTKVIKRVY